MSLLKSCRRCGTGPSKVDIREKWLGAEVNRSAFEADAVGEYTVDVLFVVERVNEGECFHMRLTVRRFRV